MRRKSKKKGYLCKKKSVKITPNRTMKTANNKKLNILEKMMEDKKAIQQCIREGGDLKKIAKKRNVKFATPL